MFDLFTNLWYVLTDPWDEDVETYEGEIELNDGDEIVAVYIKD